MVKIFSEFLFTTRSVNYVSLRFMWITVQVKVQREKTFGKNYCWLEKCWEREKKPEIRVKDFRERIMSGWRFFFPFHHLKAIKFYGKPKIMSDRFRWLWLWSMLWVCVKTIWQNSASNYKNMHIVRAVLLLLLLHGVLLDIFSMLNERMMNDPLNSCKRPIKYAFDPLLLEQPCEWTTFPFVSDSVLFGCRFVCRCDFYYSLADYIVAFNGADCDPFPLKIG